MSQEKTLPDIGEIVICTVKDMNPHGIYLTLDEYNNMIGFLHISEISTGWVRNLEKVAKPQQKMVLKVIRSDKTRMEVDLSLRQVSNEEKREKIIEWKREQKAKNMLELARKKANISLEEIKKYKKILEEKHGSLYDAFEAMVTQGEEALSGIDMPKELRENMIEIAREKIVKPVYEVGAIVELTSNSPYGIEIIKNTLTRAIDHTQGNVKITYAGSPLYRVRVTAEDYKRAEKTLNVVLEKIRQEIGKNGTFNFKREVSRKHGGMT